jgi:hypothetical protein
MISRPAFLQKLKSLNFVYISFALLLPSYIWAFLDRSIWGHDQSWYGQSTGQEVFYLSNGRFSSWLEVMLTSQSTKPPLFVWIGQIPGMITGFSSYFQPVLISFQITLLITSIIIVRALYRNLNLPNSTIYYFISLLLSSSLILGISHQYFVEILQFNVIVFVIFQYTLLVKKTTFYSSHYLLFPNLICLVLLSKITTIAILSPFLICGFIVWLRNLKNLKMSPNKPLLFLYWVLSITLWVMTSWWYKINIKTVLSHLKVAVEPGNDWSGGLSTVDKFFYWGKYYFFSAPLISVLILVLALLLIKVLMLDLKKHVKLRPKINLREVYLPNTKSLLIATCFLNVALIFTASISEIRYLVTSIGLFAVLIPVTWFFQQKRFNLKPVLYVGCILSLVFQISIFYKPLDSLFPWLTKINREATDLNTAKQIIKTSCKNGEQRTGIYINYDSPTLNDTSWNFIAQQMKFKDQIIWDCRIITQDFNSVDVNQMLAKVIQTRPAYFVVPDVYLAADNVDANVFNRQKNYELFRALLDGEMLIPVSKFQNGWLLYKTQY